MNPGSLPVDRDALETFVDETIESELASHDATGAVVSIVNDGSVALSAGYGETPYDGTPVTADATPLQTGSISKLITFTAAMQLLERDRIDSDEDVNDVLESVSIPDTYDEPITVSHLATHTAGFENRIRNETVGLEHRQSLENAVSSYQPSRIRPPGELLVYTNYAGALTGQLVADATGSQFDEYAATNVFDPLGMDRTTFEAIPNHLESDTRDDLMNYLPWYSNSPPASGLWSTGDDMAQFMLAHLNGGATDAGCILSEAATDEMHRQWFAPHETADGMAFGFFERHRDDVRLLTHAGDGPGYRSSFILVPELDLGLFVSFLGTEPGSAVWSVQDAFLDRYVPTTERELTPDGRPERADDLEGTYRELQVTESTTYEKSLLAAYFVPDTEVRIEDDGMLVTEGASTTRWVEVEPLVFRRIDDQRTLVFHEDDGEITALSISPLPYEEITARATGTLPYTLVPVSRHEDLAIQTGLAIGSSLIAFSGVLGWPLAAVVRRYRGSSPPESTRTRRSRWSAGGAGALLFGFVTAIMIVWMLAPRFGGPAVINRPPPGFGLLFVMPTAAAAATLVGAVYTVLAWYEGLWSLPARVHYTLVVGALAVLLWLFRYWNLLGMSAL
ncbi:hypothetical protein A6E15_02035 [Natrinema saccharevitans]|uniref:Beta-lactamase-related domain-containing protein n=1 Tax=Natrinema saccharevitans TaxID=301967 RepID=A0A1S8ASH7_9EURY|nr:serine hydrolase domain-containing protein [Natrinema saccharevitans]OLZ39838.1 hypothetical protein A6E15_02035 [Natrinema saccharevitans]